MKDLTQYIILVILLFNSIFSSAADCDTLKLKLDKVIYLGPIAGYKEDLECEFDYQDIRKDLIQGTLQKTSKKVFSEGAKAGKTWFSFRIQNKTTNKIWLHIAKSNIDYIDIYKLNTDGTVLEKIELGSLRGRDKNYINAYTFYIPIIVENDSNVYDLVISCETGVLREFPMMVGNLHKLNEEFAPFLLVTHFFVGGMLLILLYSLVLFIITNDISYVYYCGYVFFVTFATTFVSNFPIAELALGEYVVNTYPSLIFFLGLILIVIVTLSLLQFEKNLKFFKIALIILCVIRMLFGFSNLFIAQVYLTFWVQIVSLLILICCLVPAIILAFKKNSIAIILSIGWGAMLIGAIGHLLTLRGVLDYNFVTRSSFQIAVLVEVLVFSVVLARRINTLKSEQQKLNVELARRNYSLVHLNESLDSFNYYVSHDLKSVMVNTKSLGKMLKKYGRRGDLDKIDDISDRLIKVAESGEETVHSFLELARANNLNRSDEIEFIELETEISYLMDLNDLNNKIEFTLKDTEVKGIYIHKKAFESMMLNFLTNSIKYSDRFPKAYLKVFELETEYVLIYEDNGIGVDMKKDGDKLFTPFVRIKNTLEVEGSGVGLYIVKRMLENYNGTIEASSEVGKGTAFKIRIEKRHPFLNDLNADY